MAAEQGTPSLYASSNYPYRTPRADSGAGATALRDVSAVHPSTTREAASMDFHPDSRPFDSGHHRMAFSRTLNTIASPAKNESGSSPSSLPRYTDPEAQRPRTPYDGAGIVPVAGEHRFLLEKMRSTWETTVRNPYLVPAAAESSAQHRPSTLAGRFSSGGRGPLLTEPESSAFGVSALRAHLQRAPEEMRRILAAFVRNDTKMNGTCTLDEFVRTLSEVLPAGVPTPKIQDIAALSGEGKNSGMGFGVSLVPYTTIITRLVSDE